MLTPVQVGGAGGGRGVLHFVAVTSLRASYTYDEPRSGGATFVSRRLYAHAATLLRDEPAVRLDA